MHDDADDLLAIRRRVAPSNRQTFEARRIAEIEKALRERAGIKGGRNDQLNLKFTPADTARWRAAYGRLVADRIPLVSLTNFVEVAVDRLIKDMEKNQ